MSTETGEEKWEEGEKKRGECEKDENKHDRVVSIFVLLPRKQWRVAADTYTRKVFERA
jgi:hypothetical protein